MTVPIFSKEYVLVPSWNDEILSITTFFRDSDATDPVKRIVIPAGVWIVAVDDESRFSLTPVLYRNGREKEYESIPSVGRFQVQSESGAELAFRLSGIPNTNDAKAYRVGVTLTRLGGFEV